MVKYQGVCLPKELLNKIDEYIEGYQYLNKVDFIRQAIRHELIRAKKAGGA